MATTKHLLQAAAGAGGNNLDDYWFSVVTTGESPHYSWQVNVNGNGEILAKGYSDTASTSYAAYYLKFDVDGTLDLQFGLNENNINLNIFTDGGGALDDDGNIYACANANDTDGWHPTITKLNSSGTIVWDKEFHKVQTSSSNGSQFQYMQLNSSGDLYVAGKYRYDGDPTTQIVAKYNSSGVLQWHNTIDSTPADGNYNATATTNLALDSNENLIVGGRFLVTVSSVQYQALLVKYNSSGVQQWSRSYIQDASFGYTTTGYARGVAVDSSDNVYMGWQTGWSSSDSTLSGSLIKHNSSGAVQWTKVWGGGSQTLTSGIAVDSNDDIIAVGHSKNSGGTDYAQTQGHIIKFNSSGTEQWQRRFRVGDGSTYYLAFTDVTVDANDNIIMTAYTNNDDSKTKPLILKIPSDGSLTGTYGDYVFESSSVPVTTQTPRTVTGQFSTTETLSGVTTPNGTMQKANHNATGTVTDLD